MKKRNVLLGVLAILLVFGMVVSCDDGLGDGTTPGGSNDVTSVLTLGQNGSATQTTTQITLTFVPNISGLATGDIEISGVAGVTKGALSGTGPYTLAISGVTAGGTLSVAVNKTGYRVTTKSIAIYYLDPFLNFYQNFQCTYSNNSGKQVTETIEISKTLIKFFDNDVGVGEQADFLNFVPSKWEAYTTLPQFPGYTGNAVTDKTYTKGVKVTGKITDAKPKATDKIYGPSTCPGLNQSDLNTTEVYIYLYITEETVKEQTYLARSAFFANPAKPSQNPMNPLTGTAKREYRVLDDDD
jgi:hypothetical protein